MAGGASKTPTQLLRRAYIPHILDMINRQLKGLDFQLFRD